MDALLVALVAALAGAGLAAALLRARASPDVGAALDRVTALVHDLERGRAAAYGSLSAQITAAGQQTAALAETTQAIRQALAGAKTRGQWGERMADDVLRLAGFVEGVNYRRQRAVDGGLPDFTFLLPRGVELHMDVKFPYDNYVRALDAPTADEQARLRDRFLRDVRGHVVELSRRPYRDGPDALDCVLLFVPNEQLAAYIQQEDASILDGALARGVVLCSPLTLFAVLAVIRRSVDSFLVERAADEILDQLQAFGQQWQRFVAQMDTLGARLETAQRAYDELVGTRRRQLERPLEHLAALRRDARSAPP